MKREKHSNLIEQLAPYPVALMQAELQRRRPNFHKPSNHSCPQSNRLNQY